MASRSSYEPIGEHPSTCCLCCKTCSRVQKAVVAGVVCLLLVGVFGAVYAGVQIIVEKKIADGAVLTNGTVAEKEWRKPEIPIYTKFYFFDVDNPSEVQNKGARPSVTQRGPYAYREHRNKLNVKWSKNETTVSYLLQDYFVFDRENSVGDPKEDQVTALNFILVSILNAVDEKVNSFPEKLVTELLKLVPSESLFIKRSVHDLVWGYEDNILKMINKFDHSIPKSFSLQPNVSAPDPGSVCTVYTGVDDMSRVGQFIQWNGLSKLPYWNSTEANTLTGTEGYLFKPGNGKERIYIFVDQIFRSGYFDYIGSHDIKGISVNRFAIPEFELANASVNSANTAYYAYGPGGLCNMTTCVPMNAPVYASKPHFLDSGASLVEAVAHLSPDRSLHDSFLDMEPMTGAVFRASKRLQMNVKIVKNNDVEQLKNMPSLYFPMFWVEESAEITDHLADQFKSEVLTPVTVADNTLIALMAASGFAAVICFLLAAKFKLSSNGKMISLNDTSQ